MGNFPLSGRRVVKPGVPSIAGILVADSYSPPSFTDWQTIQTTSDNEGDPRPTSSSHTATRSPSDRRRGGGVGHHGTNRLHSRTQYARAQLV